jgi:hypothetical protein
MWDFLRDPIWQSIGAVIGALGIVSAIALGVALYGLQRHRKELGYRVLSRARVASVDAQVAERVQVLFDGQAVRGAQLVVVQILNSGNEPIVAHDYEYPLRIRTGDTSRILTAELAEHEPDTVPAPPVISETRDNVQIQPLLLNPGDWFNVTILVSEFAGPVEVHTRVVGVKQIRQIPEGSPTGKTMVAIGVGAVTYLAPISVALAMFTQAASEGRDHVALASLAAIPVWITVWLWCAPRALDRYLGSSRAPSAAVAPR